MDATDQRRALRHRLDWRLALGLCLGAAVILLLAGLLNIQLQRRHMTRLIRTSADRIADTIRLSTRDAMQRNEPQEVRRILGTIGAQPGIDRIRIFDGQGRITVSTRSEEVTELVDKRAEQCYACHAADQPLQHLDTPDRIREFEGPGGHRVLGIIAPIRNEETCWTAACHAHGEDQRILGVLDVQLSLEPVDEQLAQSEWQLGAGLLATVVAVLFLAGFLTWLFVLRPVRALTKAAARVQAGDLESRVDIESNDEIGFLGRRWNAMVEELGRNRSELEEWSRTLEARVREKSEELERASKQMIVVEKMASLGKLAAVVAHEINNPLTGIATYARLLQRKLESDPESAQALDLVEKEARRCGSIVRNLLVFSRTAESSFAEAELGPILERCTMLLGHKAELEDVSLRLEVAPDLPRIVCDAAQVQQAVLALAMNGIEAMEPGGVLTIRAQPAPAGGGIVLSVADTGCGIPRADLDQVFEPFFTTKEEGKGVGLGLAVVHGVVSHHQGHIDVDSAPGQGTTFTIRLPLRPPPAPPDEEAPL
jgi:two-component system NtrC family sensor kinase